MNVSTVVAFLAAVSTLCAAAAWVAEGGLRRLRLSTRWLWLASMAAPLALLAATLLVPRGGAPTPAPVGVIELPPLHVGPEPGAAFAADPIVAGVWMVVSLAMVALLVATHLGLTRERRGWRRTEVLGRDVYLSESRGPAVAGIVRPWIVLPRWVLTLPEAELGLVVLHEEEHVRGGDALLLGLALALVVVTPWNPATWWQLRRLRTAMEIDCDRRVLRRAPDRRRYGHSLLSVAERVSGPSLGLASFAERPLSLEQRLVAMTSKRSRWAPLSAGLLLVLAAVVLVQACAIEVNVVTDRADEATTTGAVDVIEAPTIEVEEIPVKDEPAPEVDLPPPPVESSTPSIEAGPTFTPFTVAPSILNRSEVIAAMESSYPPLLRDAGIGGTVRVYFFIDETGRVVDRRIDQSSGHEAIDQAALAVADTYRFSPALNRDEKVPVWVSFPITFTASGG